MHNIILHEDYLPLATQHASSLPETTLAAVPVELLSTDLDFFLFFFYITIYAVKQRMHKIANKLI